MPRCSPGKLVRDFLIVHKAQHVQETRNGEYSADEAQYRQSRCRRAAASFIDFVTSLSKEETQLFWLPCKLKMVFSSFPYAVLTTFKDTAYHFVSAATLMMRCALETQSESVSRNCVEKANSLIDYLRHMKTETDWDLANICLGQCEITVKQMNQDHFTDIRRKNLMHSQVGARGFVRSRQERNDRQQGQVGLPEIEREGNANTLGEEQETRERSLLPPGAADSQNVFHDFTGSITGADDWEAHAPEDFYFPELWQLSYLDPQPGSQ